MSDKNNKNKDSNVASKRGPQTVPFPKNCKEPCPYGRGREFCFPCYSKLMKEKK